VGLGIAAGAVAEVVPFEVVVEEAALDELPLLVVCVLELCVWATASGKIHVMQGTIFHMFFTGTPRMGLLQYFSPGCKRRSSDSAPDV